MKAALLTAVVLTAATAVWAESGARREFAAEGISVLRIQTESGNVEVGAGDKISVEVVGNKKPELCLLTLEAKNGAVVLKAESARRWFVAGEGCAAGFRVSAPAALALEVMAGSGKITGTGLAAGADVKIGRGSTFLTWAKAPTGAVAVKSGSGDVVLRFPKGTKLSARQISGLGSAVDAFGETPDAPLRVSVTIGSGNSTIEAAP